MRLGGRDNQSKVSILSRFKQWFSKKWLLPLARHLELSGDIFGCHSSGGGIPISKDAVNILPYTGQSLQQRIIWLDVYSVEVEKRGFWETLYSTRVLLSSKRESPCFLHEQGKIFMFGCPSPTRFSLFPIIKMGTLHAKTLTLSLATCVTCVLACWSNRGVQIYLRNLKWRLNEVRIKHLNESLDYT